MAAAMSAGADTDASLPAPAREGHKSTEKNGRAQADPSFGGNVLPSRTPFKIKCPICSSCKPVQPTGLLASGSHSFTPRGCKSARVLSSWRVLPVRIHKQSG